MTNPDNHISRGAIYTTKLTHEGLKQPYDRLPRTEVKTTRAHGTPLVTTARMNRTRIADRFGLDPASRMRTPI